MGLISFRSCVDRGQFVCPGCRTPQLYQRYAYRRFVTIYFIPVIPLGICSEQVECQGCFSRYDPSLLGAGPHEEPIDAEIVDAETIDERSVGLASPLGGAPSTSSATDSGSGASTLAIVALLLALGSLLLAVGSLLLMAGSTLLPLACLFWAMGAAASVVTGHIAIAKIGRSRGGSSGRLMAISGLAVGYLLLVLTLVPAAFALMILGDDRDGRPIARDRQERKASDPLGAAELRVMTPDGGVATGNSPEATALAQEFSDRLKTMRQVLFTPDKKRTISLSDGEFVTHCELHPGKCAFLVHVPSYRHFDSDAKDMLAKVAWMTAEGAVEDTLEPGDELAVGLRGAILYGSVMIGRVPHGEDDDPVFAEKDRKALIPFFPAPTPAAPPAEAPSDVPMDEAPTEEALAEKSPEGAIVDVSLPPKPVSPGPTMPIRPPLPARPSVPSLPSIPERPGASPFTSDPFRDVAPMADVVQRIPLLTTRIESMAFSPDAKRLACAGYGKLDLFDVETAKKLSSLAEGLRIGLIGHVAFSHDASHLIVAGSSGVGVSKVGPAGQLGEMLMLEGDHRSFRCFAVSPSADFLMTGTYDGRWMWRSFTSPDSQTRSIQSESSALSVALPKSGFLASVATNRAAMQIDLREVKVTSTRPFEGIRSCSAAFFSRDGTRLAVVRGSKIIVLDAATGSSLQTIDAAPGIVRHLAFVPNPSSGSPTRLLMCGLYNVVLWELNQGRPIARVGLQVPKKCLDISSDGKLLALPGPQREGVQVFRLPK